MSGYGLYLFGALIPFPPAEVLWALAVLDVVATIWVWRRPSHLYVLVIGLVVSLYLTVVGLFSIGILFLILFLVQVVRIAQLVSRRTR